MSGSQTKDYLQITIMPKLDIKSFRASKSIISANSSSVQFSSQMLPIRRKRTDISAACLTNELNKEVSIATDEFEIK